MLYVIIGRDSPRAQELRPTLRESHLAHLGPFVEAGKIRIAGPLTDGAGSLIVVEADARDEVQAMVDGDPYVTGGVFESVELHPFKQVFPAP